MAEQTITLLASWYDSNDLSKWWTPPAGSRPQINDDFGSPSRFIGRILVHSNGLAELAIAASQNENPFTAHLDLSNAFESAGQIELQSGSAELVLPVSSSDLTEPYFWPAGTTGVAAFYDAVPADSQATLILRDFTAGVAPAFADDTGDAIMGTVGTAIADVTVPEATGMPAPTYAPVGALPAGVSFDPASRVLSFDENAITAGSGTITIRAANSEGTADWTVDYTFSDPLRATPAEARDIVASPRIVSPLRATTVVAADSAYDRTLAAMRASRAVASDTPRPAHFHFFLPDLRLSGFSATGTVHMLMRITSGNYERGNGQENLWASALWSNDGVPGQVGVLEEGDAGITDSITLARFARWDRSSSDKRVILNAQGEIGALFDQTADPHRFTVVRVTDSGPVLMTWGPPSREASDRTFTDWRLNDGTLTQAEWDFINAIADGDEVILAVHEGTASYTEFLGSDAGARCRQSGSAGIPGRTASHPRPSSGHCHPPSFRVATAGDPGGRAGHGCFAPVRTAAGRIHA